MMNRRVFLAAAGSMLAGSRLPADPMGLPIGCQTYPHRETIGKDFEGTLRQIREAGYQTIEMCSPPGYQSSGFGLLANRTAPEMRRTIEAAGLKCESCHYQFEELKQHLAERIAFARELGLKQMVVAMFGLPKGATMADWKRAAGELNKLGEGTKKAGLQMVFHNHDFEFQKIDGALIYDELMRAFDPAVIKMQFQVSVVSIGYHAVTYFDKYPGRFQSLHLADWSETEKKQVPIGQGVVDWKKLFGQAKAAGVQNYFVEMTPELMKQSTGYLRGWKA